MWQRCRRILWCHASSEYAAAQLLFRDGRAVSDWFVGHTHDQFRLCKQQLEFIGVEMATGY